MNQQKVCEAIRRYGLVSIFRGLSLPVALKAAKALHEAGIRLVEVTCNTPQAEAIIAALCNEFEGELIIGAGTVLDPQSVLKAKKAGATFILAPDTNPAVIHAAREEGLASVPGAFSPTEIVLAMRAGADFVKVFPAGTLGAGFIKDVLGPLSDCAFMAVGGVDLTNTAAFFRAGAVSVGVGSSLLDKALLAADDMQGLTVRARQFMACVAEGRKDQGSRV